VRHCAVINARCQVIDMNGDIIPRRQAAEDNGPPNCLP
jgi:hypothetical protein